MPAKAPKETFATIRGATVAALKRPEIVKRLHEIVVTPNADPPEEFAAFIRSEIGKWGKIIRATRLAAN